MWPVDAIRKGRGKQERGAVEGGHVMILYRQFFETQREVMGSHDK